LAKILQIISKINQTYTKKNNKNLQKHLIESKKNLAKNKTLRGHE
jgi:hypothetical protein